MSLPAPVTQPSEKQSFVPAVPMVPLQMPRPQALHLTRLSYDDIEAYERVCFLCPE